MVCEFTNTDLTIGSDKSSPDKTETSTKWNIIENSSNLE